jgi:hypothetical protein
MIKAMIGNNHSEVFDSERLLREWRWLCPQALIVIDRNAFGDLFLSDKTGRVHMLDVGAGEISFVAESVAEFTERARTPEMRQLWFQESAVKSASDQGLVPDSGQCIGFSTPVVFAEGGGLDSAHIADLYEHVSFLGDIHRQIAEIPDGEQVRLIITKPPQAI